MLQYYFTETVTRCECIYKFTFICQSTLTGNYVSFNFKGTCTCTITNYLFMWTGVNKFFYFSLASEFSFHLIKG